MDGRDFQGRLLHIMPAIDRRPKDSQKLTTVKGAALKQRKADAGKDFNWSMLYMNSDAVASSIAHKLNISKSDILDSSSDTINPAVKLALAETHIIAETKKFLEENGVVLESFAKPARSPTTILVKNIPFGTTQEALLALFEPYGELNRILIPPAGTIAVVDFMQEKDANAAFRGVAYRRMKNSIIYLEKAPLGVFINDKTKPLNPIASSSNTHAVAIADPLRAVEQTTESSEAAAGSTLFVKNLNFGTTSDGLTRAFRGLTGFVFARVQNKPDPKNTGGKLSMGYGFVGFRHADDAKKAIGTMNGFVLDGHSLVVKFSGRGADTKEGEPSSGLAAKTKTTKMIVKNVPFEASKKDIRDLFSAHGQIKSIRMPR
ncbi:Multiple RNA-binding domain-containing protein 1, partial [Tulasnella sp. 418]